MIDGKLLDLLACPNCLENLEYNAVKNILTCTECGCTYEVKDGIPVLLSNETN